MDIQGQGSLFLCCLLLGGGMGLVYDGMRLARRILPHGVWAVQIEDGLYWAAVALGVFDCSRMRYYKMCSSDTGSCECIERDQKADYDPTGSGYSF